MNKLNAMLDLLIAPWQGHHYIALSVPLTVNEAIRRWSCLKTDIESLRRLGDREALDAAVGLIPVALLNVAGAPAPNARALKKKVRCLADRHDLPGSPGSMDVMIDAALAADVRQLFLSAGEEAELRTTLSKRPRRG